MEKETIVEKFRVEEWTIDNFCCWNRELHDVMITNSKSFTLPDFSTELYPRGLSGNDEHLVVRLRCSEPITFSVELSFIGSDGSLLGTQQVDSKEELDVLEFPPGPKFDEVVTQIRKNEALHGDRLTLRYRVLRHVGTKDYRCTIIDVFYASFKISPIFLEDLNESDKRMSLLKYPSDEEGTGRMHVDISKDQTYNWQTVLLKLEPLTVKKNILVLTHMSVISEDNDVIRTEENEHLFRKEAVWIFSNSLSMHELKKTKCSLIINLKIIPSNKFKQCFSPFLCNPEEVALIQTNHYGPNGSITLEESCSKNLTADETSNKPDESVTELIRDFICLFQDQDFSDFQLKCDSVSFPVHKNILSARSPVFKTMLSTDMQEASSNAVDIGDLDAPTLARFLTFLYTGAVEDLQGESALKLYYAADKYQVPTLKRKCANFLCGNVSISNVCDILLLSNKHQDNSLIDVAHKFILNNYNEVLVSEGWKNFLRNEPLLVAETLTFFAEKKYVRKT